MDAIEIRDLAVAWLILTAAFANLYGGLFDPTMIGTALIAVGTGFLLHELAHHIVARRFGLRAVFEAYYNYLGFAFLLSFAGFIFAAPGAVYTRGSRTGRQQMLISAAGPATNIVLAVLFLFVPGMVGDLGHRVNVILALFNMIPFAGLDGQSILRHSKPVYAAIVIAGVALFLL